MQIKTLFLARPGDKYIFNPLYEVSHSGLLNPSGVFCYVEYLGFFLYLSKGFHS